MPQEIDKFNILFNSMAEGVALHKYVYDKQGRIVDYTIEDVNPAFEKILKIKKLDIVGKLATKAYKVKEAPYLKEYASLITGKPLQFEVFFEPLKKYFYISACSWCKDCFATLFFDITAIKKIEQELREKNANLEKINKLMVDRELKMIELKEVASRKSKNKSI
ncbi:MAG: PAS domain-containing protein [Patescibacteria group bacterium]